MIPATHTNITGPAHDMLLPLLPLLPHVESHGVLFSVSHESQHGSGPAGPIATSPDV
jgi:hypothetical protein